MNCFKKIENQLIISYKLTLAIEGEKICKEIDSILGDYEDLVVEKANTYCLFFYRSRKIWF